jgi:hypothetical protein
VGAFFPFRSAAAMSKSPYRCLFLFFLEWLEAPSSATSSRFALPQERSKIALTTSSPEAWLVAMSRSSLVVLGHLRPSLWTRDSYVVPDSKSPMTSASTMSGSSLHCPEKR